MGIDSQQLIGKRVGYYIGSFDPLHKGHQFVIDTALEKYVDYVLVYPAPGGDIYKKRVDLSLRLQMIESIYQGNPKVLLTRWSPKELQEKFAELDGKVEVIGIIGSDVITDHLFGPDKEFGEKYRRIFMRGGSIPEKYYERTEGALMALKATSFLVSLRGNVDLSFLNGYIEERPILGFIHNSNQSSTEVKKAISEGRSIENLVESSVEKIIREEKLYG